MRVAHVIQNFGGLSESFIANVLEDLEGAGCESWIVTKSVKNRHVYPFPPDEHILVASRPSTSRRVYDRFRNHPGAERFARSLMPNLAELGFDLVHAHFGWAGRAGMAVANLLGRPLVVSYHGSDVTTVATRMARHPHARRHPYSDVFERTDLAIVVSRFIEEKLRGLGYTGPLEVLPAGVRLEQFAFRPHEPPADPFRLLQIGRLVPQKGLPITLRALGTVAAEIPNVHLEVIGAGPERDSFERLARHLGVDRRVTFHGPVLSVIPGLRAAHIVVVPSRVTPDGRAEGSPVVTKEAQATGVPVVATDTGGMAETIPPPYRAELVPGDDPDALARRIVALAHDPEGRRERSRVGRAWVEQEFDARSLTRRTVEIYRRLAGDRSGRFVSTTPAAKSARPSSVAVWPADTYEG